MEPRAIAGLSARCQRLAYSRSSSSSSAAQLPDEAGFDAMAQAVAKPARKARELKHNTTDKMYNEAKRDSLHDITEAVMKSTMLDGKPCDQKLRDGKRTWRDVPR